MVMRQLCTYQRVVVGMGRGSIAMGATITMMTISIATIHMTTEVHGTGGRAWSGRGSRQKDDFDGQYFNDGDSGFTGGYSSGCVGQYSDGDSYNEEYY